jgi:hypothetical protein
MTDLIPQLESSLSFARELNALREQNRVLREAMTRIAQRPSGHHDCDDYTRGYGQCKADMANIAEAALTNKVPA